MKDILQRLTWLCVSDTSTGRKPRKHEQRLLRNMGAHSAILELLEIPYEKVIAGPDSSSYMRLSGKTTLRNPRAECEL